MFVFTLKTLYMHCYLGPLSTLRFFSETLEEIIEVFLSGERQDI